MWNTAGIVLWILLWAALMPKTHTGDFQIFWKAMLWVIAICTLAALIAFLTGPILAGVFI